MWVAAAFARREAAEKVALALGRHGLGVRAFTSGAEVLRQAEGLACVVCGPRLQDMTAARLRAGQAVRQAAEHVLRLLDDREATLARAKRALIRQRGLAEAQAHRLLQRRAMETGASVLDAARAALRTLAKEEET